jgi:hypothetical protein
MNSQQLENASIQHGHATSDHVVNCKDPHNPLTNNYHVMIDSYSFVVLNGE